MIIPKLDIETEKKIFFKNLEQKNKGVFDFYGKVVKEYLDENGLLLDWENCRAMCAGKCFFRESIIQSRKCKRMAKIILGNLRKISQLERSHLHPWPQKILGRLSWFFPFSYCSLINLKK